MADILDKTDIDKSLYVGDNPANGNVQLTIDTDGNLFCNNHVDTAQQAVMWFNKKTTGFIIDNAQTPNPVYLLIKDKDGSEYAVLIDSKPNTAGYYWKFYKLSDTSVYPITLTEVGNTRDNNFKNLYSILRYSTGEIENFNHIRQHEYGVGIDSDNQCLIINGLKSDKYVIKDDVTKIFAKDYFYIPIGTKNVNMTDSTMFNIDSLQRIDQFQTANGGDDDLRIVPTQLGIMVMSGVDAANTNPVKVGNIKYLLTGNTITITTGGGTIDTDEIYSKDEVDNKLDNKVDKTEYDNKIKDIEDKIGNLDDLDNAPQATIIDAINDALTAKTGKVDGATLDGVEVPLNNKILEFTLPVSKADTLGIAKAGEGLTYGADDGEIILDETKVVMVKNVDTVTLSDLATKVPASSLVKQLLELKQDKIIPTLTAGENYDAKQLAFKDDNLVRVVKDIVGYNETANAKDISVLIDDVNMVDYFLIHHFVLNNPVKTGAYIFHKCNIYRAKVDIDAVTEDILVDPLKFDEIYTHTETALPIATADKLGGVKIGDGIKIDPLDGTISIDETEIPVVEYLDADQKIKKNWLVIRANKLYIAKADIADTTGWANDEVNMEPVCKDANGEIEIIDYDGVNVGEEIARGKLVTHQDKLYLVKTTFDKVDFDTDKANLLETALQVDLEKYYTKDEVDALLLQKAPISVPTLTNTHAYKANQLVLTDKGFLAKVKQDIANFNSVTDADKIEPIVDATGYVTEQQLEDALKLKADLVIPSVTAGENYVADQLVLLDGFLAKTLADITGYNEANDKDKIEIISNVPIADDNTPGGVIPGKGLKLDKNTGIVDVLPKADGGIIVDADGVSIDDTAFVKKATVGDLANLKTTDKTSIVDAINELADATNNADSYFAHNADSNNILWTADQYAAVANPLDKVYLVVSN